MIEVERKEPRAVIEPSHPTARDARTSGTDLPRPAAQPPHTVESDEPRRGRLFPWLASVALLLALAGAAVALASWKSASLAAATAASGFHGEPTETITAAVVEELDHRRTTVAIGTVLALQSITLRNELPGTVAAVDLDPGTIVEPGTVLVALDVSVEEAELQAQEAQVALAATVLERLQRAGRAASAVDVDRAKAEHDIALAQVARTRAIIERKTIRAPFRSRIGLSDVHVGQYLGQGTELTTLQGVDTAVHVDFAVTQEVAAGLRVGDRVEVTTDRTATPETATVVAIDARIDRATRNATVRARLEGTIQGPAPGASVRVRVPIGNARRMPAIPADALRRGPEGDHVFVVVPDDQGALRARQRSVETTTLLGGRAVIRSGLVPGERVATAGSFKLRDGVLVTIANAVSPDGSAAQSDR